MVLLRRYGRRKFKAIEIGFLFVLALEIVGNGSRVKILGFRSVLASIVSKSYGQIEASPRTKTMAELLTKNQTFQRLEELL